LEAKWGGNFLKFQQTRHITNTIAATCPNYGLTFKDSTSVLKHMNHWFSSCHKWFDRSSLQPDTGTGHPSLQSHSFLHASHVFDSGNRFLGWFHNNEDAGAQRINPYHLFLFKGEWEIAGFLTHSDMSMKLINEFLLLRLVSSFKTPNGIALKMVR
jgi:hypothetical protein